MKVYFDLEVGMWSLFRFWEGLLKFKPSFVEIVSNHQDADIVMTWINVKPGQFNKVWKRMRGRKPRACFLEMAEHDKIKEWLDPTDLVFTYNIDTFKYLLESGYQAKLSFHGVDDVSFWRYNLGKRRYDVVTYSYQPYEFDAELNSVLSELGASEFIAGREKHDSFYRLPDWNVTTCKYFHPASDTEALVDLLNQSLFISGLTATRGLERSIAEGLLCGAQPIAFRSEDYKYFFLDHVIYFNRGDFTAIKGFLKDALRRNSRRRSIVSEQAIAYVKEELSFKKIAPEMFSSMKRFLKGG